MPKRKKVEEFTRPEARRVKEEVAAKVNDVARQLGLEVQFGNARFAPDELRFPITFTLGGEAAEKFEESREAEFKQFASSIGLKPEHFGKEVDLPDGTYKIVGCKPRATKNNVIIEKTKTRTGKRAKPGGQFVYPHTEILHALGDETVSVGEYDVID